MSVLSPLSRELAVLGAMSLLALSGCRSAPSDAPEPVRAVVVEEEPGWRRAASPEDAGRIDRLEAAWEAALSAAARAGHRRLVAREGDLLEPGAALPMPAPTPGSYLCRLLRFAPASRRGPVLTVYRPFFCHIGVDGDALTLIKQTGSERPAGHLWTDRNPSRLIFLGTLSQGSDERPLAYRDNPERDMVAVFERVDAFRFRLVAPWPQNGATLDIYELTPSPRQWEE